MCSGGILLELSEDLLHFLFHFISVPHLFDIYSYSTSCNSFVDRQPLWGSTGWSLACVVTHRDTSTCGQELEGTSKQTTNTGVLRLMPTVPQLPLYHIEGMRRRSFPKKITLVMSWREFCLSFDLKRGILFHYALRSSKPTQVSGHLNAHRWYYSQCFHIA